DDHHDEIDAEEREERQPADRARAAAEPDDARPRAERAAPGALAEREVRIDPRGAEAREQNAGRTFAAGAQRGDERVAEAVGGGDVGFGNARRGQAPERIALAGEQPARRGDE